ncbi:unnamed protein product [Rotaria sp. Silwood2]|nr:unnamed protein product [Rotaria sp. Silwood2]
MPFTITRFTDLHGEPVSLLLASINGYQDEPLEPLEKTLEPIAHFFIGIEINAWVAKENCIQPKEGLTQDESAAIHLYTMNFCDGPSLYEVFNQALRAKNRQDLRPWFKLLKLFLTALHKLPSHAQTVWCGARNIDLSSKYPKGKKLAWWGVRSCLTSLELLQSTQYLGQTGDRAVFAIECLNGKSISLHSYFGPEEEIILLPGFYFEVIDQISPEVGLHIIQIREINPSFLLVTPPFVEINSFSTSLQTTQTDEMNQLKNSALDTPTNLIAYRNKVGETFSFVVTGTTRGSVWGTDVYTDDSILATTAVHAGVVKNGETKTITVKILPGQFSYRGTLKNGITSVSYGAWAGSYLFVENPVTYEISSPNLSGYRNKVGHMYSFIVTGTIVGSVWGTDIYTDDSNLATAAVHAGVANNNETKVVHIKILPGQSSYEGTIRNGDSIDTNYSA